jgi:hypothetical protein
MREEHHIRGKASRFCVCRPPAEEPWILTPDMMVNPPAAISPSAPWDSDFTPDSEAGVNSFEWPTDIDADLILLDSQPPLFSAATTYATAVTATATATAPVITIDVFDVDAINSLAVTLQSCMEHKTQ